MNQGVPPSNYGAQYGAQGPPQQNYHGGPVQYQGQQQQQPQQQVHSVSQFVQNTQSTSGKVPFEVDKSRVGILQVNFGCPATAGGVLQQVYMKKGSMVAYQGDIKFEREGLLEHGVGHMLKKAVTSEGATLVRATMGSKGSSGRAHLYLADNSKVVTVLQLQGESLTVNGDDLLAFEPSLKHQIVMLKKVSAIISGGLFNVKLSGYGCVAILSHGKPITLLVKKGQPSVFTDPQATVAWSGSLNPDFNTDIQFKTLLGRGSGDSFQMKFDPSKGEGFVVVQPCEEIGPQRS